MSVFHWNSVNSLGYIPTDQKDAINNQWMLTSDGQLYIPNGMLVGAITNVTRQVSTNLTYFAVTDNTLEFTSGTAFTFPPTKSTQKGRQITLINKTGGDISIAPTNTTETIYRTLIPNGIWRATSNGVKWVVGL